MKQNECRRCNYKWYSRTKMEPKACAKCKSYKWNEDKTRKRKPNGKKK